MTYDLRAQPAQYPIETMGTPGGEKGVKRRMRRGLTVLRVWSQVHHKGDEVCQKLGVVLRNGETLAVLPGERERGGSAWRETLHSYRTNAGTTKMNPAPLNTFAHTYTYTIQIYCIYYIIQHYTDCLRLNEHVRQAIVPWCQENMPARLKRVWEQRLQIYGKQEIVCVSLGRVSVVQWPYVPSKGS